MFSVIKLHVYKKTNVGLMFIVIEVAVVDGMGWDGRERAGTERTGPARQPSARR